MSYKKAARSSLDPSRTSVPQWLQGMLVGAALLVVGRWAASRYANGWTSNSVLDYVKSTGGGQTAKPYGSSISEPWSKVR